MEVKGNILSSFDIYHNTVLDTLRSRNINCDKGDLLRFIGISYAKFLASDQQTLSLHVPFYKETFVDDLVDYLVTLDLLIKVFSKTGIVDFKGTSLYDGFSYTKDSNRSVDHYFKPFNRQQNEALFYEDEIVVSQHRFIPMFNSNETSLPDCESIDIAFSLFATIARMELLHEPVLINLKDDVTLFLSTALSLNGLELLTRGVNQRSIDRNGNIDEILDELATYNISRTISVKYPYYTNIDSRILREFPSAKKFEICMKSRICYSEIDSDEVMLLKREIEGLDFRISQTVSNFEILDSRHDSSLFEYLRGLRLSWKEANLNPYKSPFPGKWFLCIHQGEPLEFWTNSFRADFPLVIGFLLQNALKVIEQIYQINWAGNILTPDQEAIVIPPNSNSFSRVFSSFQNFLTNQFRRVFIYTDKLPYRTFEGRRIVILDPFNKVLFANLGNVLDASTIKVICPDFIYFNYQPFAKYFIAQYQFDALIQGARIWYDPNYENSLHEWESLKKVIIKESGVELRKYEEKYLKIEEQALSDLRPVDRVEVLSDDSFSELTEPEVVEMLDNRRKPEIFGMPTSIEVITADGTKYFLKPDSLILLEDHNHHIIQTTADNAIQGWHFVPISEIDKAINKTLVAEKMVAIPKSSLNWKYELFLRSRSNSRLYRTLGLSVLETTFNNDYLSEHEIVNSTDLHLPRAKMDWEIVCDYLGVREMEEVWRFHKCKDNINSLKKAYREVISYMSAKSLYGQNLEDDVLREIAQLFERHTGVHESEKERISTARSIARQITKYLALQEIVHVNIEQYEQSA